MIQKRDYQRRINLLQVQFRWGDLQTVTGVFEEQLERIGIGVANVVARMAFDGQALPQESRDVRCNRCHGFLTSKPRIGIAKPPH